MPGRRKTNPRVEEVSEKVEEVPTEETPEQPAEAASETAEEVVTHDESDVPEILSRDTQDGKGADDVPEPDFESYATEGVEKTKTVQEVASEVLAGVWGKYGERRARLGEAGYDPTEVEIEVNRRRSAGAPYAYSPSPTELAAQVNRGEWGSEREQRIRLEGAGYVHRLVLLEVERLRGR